MRKKKNSKKLRSALAFLLAGSMLLGTSPGGIGQVYAADAEASVKEEQTGLLDKAKDFFSDMGEGIAEFFVGEQAGIEPAAAFDETSVVDADTSQGWINVEQLENSTMNIGRIWTDKSVYKNSVTLPGIGEEGQEIPIEKPEDSDFLVGLSALSSTSNISVTTTVPLDIVLVLDVSGSMEQELGQYYVYTKTYTVDTGGGDTYYALNKNGEYEVVKRVTKGWLFDHWEFEGKEVDAKIGENDPNSDHVQFYTRRTEYISKIDGLKTAVNGFIDATAKQNESITDPAEKHHISVVKYADDSYYQNNPDSVGDNKNQNGYNYSQIVSNLTGDMTSLKNAVNGLDEAGATAADYGMSLANRVLNKSANHGAREGAKEVVILFTDGQPNHQSGFDTSVATDAIESAKSLKDAGALVYSIGVVDDADPDANIRPNNSSDINAYLHSVSSNYPDAVGWERSFFGGEWNLGERVENSNFYKAATNSEELNNIFQEISQEINSGTGYPTQTEQGFENKDGYVTFQDQLGDYMQVDSFNSLVLDDKIFTAEKTESEGKIQYTYSGEVDLNGDGKMEEVSNIVITVTPGEGSLGDTVDVSIPAILLPLRNFNVDITGNTMSVEDKYPLRLFYNASLKEEAKEILANPDQEMKNYIGENNADGNVYFYSNKFTEKKTESTEEKTLGDTLVTFEPAIGNTFYYFTENTFLWEDEEMSIPVTKYSDQEKYYYAKTYYEMNDGAPKEVTVPVSFRAHSRDEVEEWVGTAENGQLYITKGAPRLTRISDLTASKTENTTGTATEVIAPNWDDDMNQKNIIVSLGNNGRLAVELPGTLEIKKTVVSEVTAPEKEFTFKLSLTDAEDKALTGEFDAQKFDAQGKESGETFKVENGDVVALKDGESVKVYGLSNGDLYNIEETDIPEGFAAATNPITGAIVGNEVQTAEFVNTYTVTPAVLEGDSSIRAKKKLAGRDWQEGDSFKVVLQAVGDAPLPETGDGTSVEGNVMTRVVENEDVFSFGKLIFDRPGTYTYIVYEPNPGENEELLGVSYSDALYRVDVVVADDGKGTLSAERTMTQRLDDLGQAIEGGEGTVVEDGIAVFTNTFEAKSVQWGLTARKDYTDNSGAKPLTRGMFRFQVETVVNEVYPDAGPLPGGVNKFEVSNGVGGQISFGQASFDEKHNGKTYLYKITEVVPEGVTAENPSKDGMTYDTSVYYLRLSFGVVEDADGNSVMTIMPEYLDENQEVIPDKDEIVFENVYTPTPVIVGGEGTETVIEGSKTLNGRAMKEGEFSFELTARNRAAESGLEDDSIVFEEDAAKTFMTVNAPAADNGAKVTFDFGSVKFTKPGEYTFNMKEVVPEQDEKGMTYDRHTAVATVNVTDNNGVLEAEVSYEGGEAAFENTYKASHSYVDDGAAIVTKTLNGRNMKAGEFRFTIKGTGDNAEAANAKLEESDESFQNYAQKAGVASEMPKLRNIQFTEADAGQTFIYLIDEVMPTENERAGGVTYDESEFTLAIAVTDDGDGTMSTRTTVTRTKKADGTEISEELGTYGAGDPVVRVPFVNTYKADPITVDTSDVESGLRLNKIIEGRDWGSFDSFTFTMVPQDGAPMPEANPEEGITYDESGNLQVTVKEKGGTPEGRKVSFGFGPVTYDKVGTYVYTVTENVPEFNTGGMTYSDNKVTITVEVTDPGTGRLEVWIDAVGSKTGQSFINTYDTSLNLGDAGGLAITKTLTGHALAEGQFDFRIKAVGTDTATEEEAAELFGFDQGETEITFKNTEAAADGDTVTMEKTDVDFSKENLGKAYKYEITEVKGTQGGYTYDDTVYTVELEVSDNKKGIMTLYTTVTKDGEVVIYRETSSAAAPSQTVLSFNNSYAAEGELEGVANLEVTKNLKGRKWNENDKFNFRLEATGDTLAAVENKVVTLPDNANELAIDGSDEDHKASFGNIRFTKPGTYTFAVSEIIPDDAVNANGGFVLNGITYDSSVKTITVTVVEEDTENGNGTLVATVAADSDELVFTNEYKASSVTLDTDEQFKVTKELVGREWTEDDAFEFALTAKDGTPMPAAGETVVTAKANAKTQSFGAITYEAAGTYTYQITEVVPESKEDGMTYDTHTATVTVEIEENLVNGTLSVKSVTYSDGEDGAQFTNVVGNNTKDVQNEKGESLNNGMIGVGDELTYVINWVNDGVDEETGAPAAATVKITDTIPTGTEYVADSATEDAVYDENERTLTWTIDAKAAATGSVSFKVRVTEEAGGTAVENQAYIQIGDHEPDVTNTVQTHVPGKSEISNPDKIEEGTILTYQIKFRNTNGANAAAEVVDNMTPGLEYQLGTAQVDGAAFEPNVEGTATSGQTLTWNLENLAEGADVIITFDVKVTRDALESVENGATINGHQSNVVTTPYPSDDKKTVEDENGKDQNNGMVGVGDRLTYTIDWAAEETGTVTVTDKVPTGTKFLEASEGGKLENGTVTWIIEDVKKGQKGSVSFTVEVTNDAAGKDVLNRANVQVGKNDPKVTNEVETFIPGKDSVVEDGGELQVGSVLNYTISYKNPEAEAATVTITDVIPAGLDYVDGSAGENATYDAASRTLTWTLADVPAGTDGTVTFKARVNESAVEKVENQATIQIGENDPKYKTDIDSKPVPKGGNLAISKTIALTEGQGTAIDEEKTFEFTVHLTDVAEQTLTGEYNYTVTGKEEVSKIKDGGKISLKHGETATITGLPAGTKYTVIESKAAGYTPDAEQITGSVAAEQTSQADFTNTYNVEGSLNGDTALNVVKVFTGREGNQWLAGDKFTFALTAADKATQNAIEAGLITLPQTTELTIDSTMEEKQAAFGDITFNIAGTFKFNVTEKASDIAGVTDDNEPVRELVVNVTDNKDGTLTATVADGSDNLTFENVYGGTTGDEDIAAQINATKKLTGRDMNAGEFTFEVATRAVEGAEEFKETVVAEGTNAAKAENEAAQVTFAGKDGKALTYTTEALNEAVGTYVTKSVNESGETVWIVNYTARENTKDLPSGVTAVKASFDFAIVVTDKTDGTLTTEVQYPEGGIAFENEYATGGTEVDTDPTETTALFEKVLAGRDWLDTDAFTFKIEPQDGAPAPVDAEGNTVTEVTVTKADVKNGKAPFGFGTIHFTDEHMGTASTKEFNYRVTEADLDAAAMPGVSKDTHEATLSITLTDDGEGTLSAATPIVTGGTFTNTYKSELDYNAVGGLQISKVLNGRDMQNNQFTFNVTPKATEGSTTAEEAAQKLGFAEVKAYEFKNEAADMGETTYINVLAGKEVVFTQADAGKTYTYEIAEVKGKNDAYTYDEAVNIVTISVVDQNNGTMTVTTTVTKNGAVIDTKTVNTDDAAAAPATAPFVNVYNDKEVSLGGDGEVSINATKSLTNRPMVDKEFIFNVTDQNGTVVATGDNDVSGKITFTPIIYTTDKLNADAEAKTALKSYDAESDAYTYTYQYIVTENLENVDEGVTGIATTFSIKVIVTDDGQGTLQIAVVYPDGKDPLPFKNAYGADENGNVEINVNGQKVLNVESGDNAPDITGSYNFTLSGSDGAPMPEKTTAVNDAAGNVDFGEITYTMENVFGDTGSAKETAKAETETETGAGIVGTENAETEIMPISEKRTKTFTYTVTEAGSVEGVINDPESVKTFNVAVTDNGDGTLKVDKDYTGFEFAFTNTYRVDPIDVDINDAETGITVKKELTGRAMNAGEFVFELISDKDKSIREAVNDAEGNVKFETINFTAPGVYTYTLRERNTNLGGVEYDTAEYEVVVTVTDNGNGTMSAEAKLADDGREVVFENHYEAAPTSVMFGASKIYKGADLKDGQFTFVVKDAEGKVVSEATNNKDGMVAFETMEFDKEGTYTFTIFEKNDKQKNVTYDKTEYTVTVQVTDNLNGQLEAEVIYEDEKAPVFTNKYTKPAEPQKPEEPKTPGTVQTGDNTPIVGLVVAMVVALAAIVAVAVILFKRRRK